MTDLRRIDALVAEHVMGRKANAGTYDPESGAIARFHLPELPHYSSSIAAAWEVVEKFNFFHLYRYPLGWVDHGRWECKLRREDEDRRYYSLADTAPLAICLAALKAKGVEVE